MFNLHEFFIGESFCAQEYFGAHITENGCTFRTFAPSAQRVCVIGDFNAWHEDDMSQPENNGVWQTEIPAAKAGQLYKYVIYSQKGRVEHCDPYSVQMELRPNFASVIVSDESFDFDDEKWLRARTKNYDTPLNIYELHLGSWRRKEDGTPYKYDEIGGELIAYVKAHGFTHVELMPLSEHPVDASWGYQNTGFFAPTSRYGTKAALKKLIKQLHAANIGAILDFVPFHFALDSYALANYDGAALYEYDTKDVGVSEWGTHNFNFARGEVRSFMQSAAAMWLGEFHFDGLRMDAVSRAIYWLGDPARGVNPCSVAFIKTMNAGLLQRYPTAMLIAEDSTAFPKVTAPVAYDGLGFDYKWDLGFMNDTLEFMSQPPAARAANMGRLEFSMRYFYNELYILPFSHDEVVHGKKTIIDKLYGTYEEKFAEARLLYMYMFTHPGKKLNFMGNELAMFREWDEARECDYDLLKYPAHSEFNAYFKALSTIYAADERLYKGEYDSRAFNRINPKCDTPLLYAFERGYEKNRVTVLLNFSDKPAKVEFPKAKIIFATSEKAATATKTTITLAPYDGVIVE